MKFGDKIGRLTLLGKDESKDERYYFFQCDCGNVKSIIKYNVEKGATKSCGCLKRDFPNHVTYGYSHTRLDNIYKTMLQRCFDENCKSYPRYGKRGITVCKEWRSNKLLFFSWAMTHGYQDNLTLDRIYVNGNYEPSNCRWSTPKVQQNNRSNNRKITFKNETHTLAEWADLTNIKVATIWARLDAGWTIEKTLTTSTIRI